MALVQSVEMAKALAGKWVVEFARELSFFNVQICKVEFNQPSCWLYSVPNLLVF